MQLRALHNFYNKKYDIYVVGTGPTIQLFPKDFFDNKITIGLNQAYKLFNPTWSITVHPYLIPPNHGHWNTKWITKVKPSDPSWKRHVRVKNTRYFYFFNNVEFFEVFDKPPSDDLYVGRGIHTGGIHLAYYMGAKNIILVGCDFACLNGYHHGHDQHIELHGFTPEQVYDEYYYYLVKLRETLKINILNLTPLFGRDLERDHKRLWTQQGQTHIDQPKEVEYNARIRPLVSDFI